MNLRSGDCLAWRCLHRCDLTFHELVADEVSWWRGSDGVMDLIPGLLFLSSFVWAAISFYF